MRKYIIQSDEEECGKELFVLIVDEEIPDKVVKAKVKMAIKYANVKEVLDDNYEIDIEKGKNLYDEHYEEMLDVHQELNGQYAFHHYGRRFR